MEVLRVCYVHIEGVMDFTHMKEEYPLNYLGRILMKKFSSKFNITLRKEDVSGSLISPSSLMYDGCIGALQSNESDVAFIAPAYPLITSNIEHQNILSYDYPVIGSVYHKTNLTDGKTTRVLDFLAEYSSTCWHLTFQLSLMLFFLIFITLSNSHKHRHRIVNLPSDRAFRDSEKILFSCIFKHHSSCANVRARKFTNPLYVGLTMLTYYVAFFMTSQIKTDMVILKTPPTYNTYQQLLDEDVRPIWVAQIDDQKGFQYASEGSLERRIWDRAVERGIEESMVRNIDLKILFNRAQPVLRREAVMLDNNLMTELADSNGCAYMRSWNVLPGTYVWTRRDPSAKETMRVFVTNAKSSLKFKRETKRLMTRVTEMSVPVTEVMRSVRFIFHPETKIITQVMECMSNVIVMPENNLVAVKPSHYQDLTSVCFLIIVLAFLACIHEKVRSKRSGAR